MTTYTVFNMESEDGFEEWKGLTLSGAVGLLMQLSNCSMLLGRDPDGIMRMEVFPDCAADEGALESSNPDDEAAGREIFERFADAKITLRSTYYLVTDEKFQQERLKYVDAVTV